MTLTNWQRLQEIFDAVVELPEAERERALEEHCGGDATLRRMVESLLHCEGGQAVEQAVAGAVKSATSTLEPNSIPNFRIVRRLGEGGMGVVYEAEQLQPRRKVALKLIRSGQFATERERRMFEREAEALARLVHPGIASIFESGTAPGGQPYLAMEFVEGQTLTEYVGQQGKLASLRRQDVRGRIELFLEICDAVSYAHQRGVIHRDLKPTNVMVSEGRVKVLDFGLARIETELELTRTETGVVQGSLRYMSPEQARGESSRIDTRSDLYSLGVVLYEMLTGMHPYLDRTDLLGAVQQICETPMRSLRTAKVPFSQDLETILAKALAKDTGQRYEGVASLATDLRRFLANETILARPATLRYQLRQLIVRNKLAAGALAAVLLLVTGFAVYAFQQSVKIAAERDRANLEAATATQVSDFLVKLFSEANPAVAGGELTARQLLQAGRKRLETELKDKPEIKAQLLENIGHSFNVVGPVDEAIRAFEDAIRLRAPDDLKSASVWSGLSDTYYNLGRYADSVKSCRKALEIKKKHLPESSDAIAGEMGALALGLAANGELEEAAALFGRLEEMDRQYGRQNKAAARERFASYGAVLRRQKRYPEAEAKLRKGLEALKDSPKRALRLRARNDLGLTLSQLQKFDEADAVYGEMLTELAKLYGQEHPNVAIVELNRMNSWIGLKRNQEALDRLKDIRKRLASLPEKHPVRCDLDGAEAAATAGLGKRAEGKRLFDEAIKTCGAHLGEKHPNVLNLITQRDRILNSY